MGGCEAQGLVETDGIGALLVGGQLDQAAALRACLLDRPLDHPPAKAPATLAGRHPDRLDLAAQHAVAAEPRQEGELQRPDDAPLRLGDEKMAPRVGLELVERREVGVVVARPLPARAERVIG